MKHLDSSLPLLPPRLTEARQRRLPQIVTNMQSHIRGHLTRLWYTKTLAKMIMVCERKISNLLHFLLLMINDSHTDRRETFLIDPMLCASICREDAIFEKAKRCNQNSSKALPFSPISFRSIVSFVIIGFTLGGIVSHVYVNP